MKVLDDLPGGGLLEGKGQVVGDQYWHVTNDGVGTVYDYTTLEELGQFEVDSSLTIGSFFESVTDNDVVLRVNELDIFRIDRSDYSVTQLDLDIRPLFDGRLSLSGGWLDAAARYIEYRVSGPEGTEQFLLASIDDGGSINGVHTIASAASEYGFDNFYFPQPVTIGDRLFIQDHLRRLVEVDVPAMAAAEDEWADPGLDLMPVLTGDEQEVIALATRFLEGEAVELTEPGRTDDVAASVAASASAGRDLSSGWMAFDVTIDGDRAWARLLPAARSRPDFGLPVTFMRQEGLWAVDVDSWCAVMGACES